MQAPSTEKSVRWVALLVCVLAAAPYLNALDGDFTFDDTFVIRDNPALRDGSLRQLTTHLLQPGPVWRPLTMLSYGANEALSGAAWSYHAVNVLLHLGVTLSAFALAAVLLQSTWAALIASALFAVHPIHTEAVTSIVGRAELIAALAILTSLCAAVRALDPRELRPRLWNALSVACFSAGPFAKESALTGIGLLIVLQAWLEPHAPLRRRLRFALPFVAAGVVYLALRAAVVGSLAPPQPPTPLDNPLAHVPFGPRFGTAIVVLWEYVQLLLLPLHLSADYSYHQIPLVTSWKDPRLLLAAEAFLAVAVVLLLGGKHTTRLRLGVLFFLVPLALTANLLFPIGTIKAERLLYLPSFGGCLVLAALPFLLAQRRKGAWTLAAAALIAALAARTWVRNRDWHDNYTLFSATVVTSPNSAKAHHNLAVAEQLAGRLDAAAAHFRRSLEINPQYADAAFGLGRVYQEQRLDGAAVHWYEKTVRMEWRAEKAHLNLGLVRYRHGEFDTAEAAFLAGLDVDPKNSRLSVSLAAARIAIRDVWGARAAINRNATRAQDEPEVQDLFALASRSIDEVAQQ